MAFVLGQVQTAARNNGRSDVVTLIITALVAPPSSVINASISFSKDFALDVRDAHRLRRENEQMRADLNSMQQYQETMDRLNARIQSLSEMNDYVPQPPRKKLYANIIGYSPAQNSILIDRGSNDGIQKYQPVIAAKGLIGVIEVADPKRSRVLLLTSPSIRISTIILGESAVKGIVRGATPTRLAMDLFETDVVSVGSTVETSGFSETIPAGIHIGTVIEAVHDERFGTKRVFVLPSARINDISEVFVLR